MCFWNRTCESESENASVREWMLALNTNKLTFIGKKADASHQCKQTNLYQCGSEEFVLTRVKKFGTTFVIDKQTVVFIDMLSHVKKCI